MIRAYLQSQARGSAPRIGQARFEEAFRDRFVQGHVDVA